MQFLIDLRYFLINLIRMINFLGIGAPKCATTWLAACLSDHPEIFMPAKKEVSFFSAKKNGPGIILII